MMNFLHVILILTKLNFFFCSVKATNTPSYVPSRKPSYLPSIYPSKSPISKMPTFVPTLKPTRTPSLMPTVKNVISASFLNSSLNQNHPRLIVSSDDWARALKISTT